MWTGEAVAMMHIYELKMSAVAQEAGCTASYLSMLLNGKRKPDDAQDRVMGAINRTIKKMMGQ